jgi:DNA polymerase I
MTVLIIDTSYLIYRSFFAYPSLTSKGLPTGAFFGFAKTILALIHEYKPDELIFANDTSAPTWRHKILDNYKGNRPEIQDEMLRQIPLIKDWITRVSPNVFSQDGFEADDYVFTVCKRLLSKNSNSLNTETYTTEEQDLFKVKNSAQVISELPPFSGKILIFSSDRDLYQILVHSEVFFVQTKALKDGWQLFGKEEFKLKYGLEPEQWLDYKALTGDASDNLKGIPGVGPKTATKILQQVGCLYNLIGVLGLDNVDLCSVNVTKNQAKEFVEDPKNQGIIDKIKANLDVLRQTYYLATLQDVPDTSLKYGGFDLSKGMDEFYEFGFKSLVSLVSKITVEDNQPDALF